VDAQARLRGRLVVVLAGVLLLRSDIRLSEHLERMAGRHQPDRVVALLERPAFGCGRLLDGQLGQRLDLQPLVGDRLAAADRAAVAAGGKPRLDPLQRRPSWVAAAEDEVGDAAGGNRQPVGGQSVQRSARGSAAVWRAPPATVGGGPTALSAKSNAR
jgi:hypothetical protein